MPEARTKDRQRGPLKGYYCFPKQRVSCTKNQIYVSATLEFDTLHLVCRRHSAEESLLFMHFDCSTITAPKEAAE